MRPVNAAACKIRLDHLRRLGGVEAGRVIGLTARDGALHCAGGERLRPTLRDHRIHTSGDRIPDQFRQARDQAERIQHHTLPAAGGTRREG